MKHAYASILKDEIIGFLEMRKNQKLKDKNKYILASLDKYLVAHSINEKSLTAKTVDAWLADACKEQSIGTLRSYIGYCNVFAKYLHMFGIEMFAPEYVRTRETYVPYIFSENEIDSIFAAADDINVNSYIASQIQFSLLLRILYGCGLRLGEALSLKKADIDTANGVLFIRNAKGNRDRFVPMDFSLNNEITKYSDFLLQNKPEDAWVFERNKNQRDTDKPRSTGWAKYAFLKVLSKAGIDLPELPRNQRNICLHCLRHTFIVRSFRKQDIEGADNYDPAASISVYVGHVDLKGTQRYMQMTAESSIDIINATTAYSKGMFPSIPDKSNAVIKNEEQTITKLPKTMINSCSKGMFPGVPL